VGTSLVCFKVKPEHSPGGTEEDKEKTQALPTYRRAGFECDPFLNHTAGMCICNRHSFQCILSNGQELSDSIQVGRF
jgi:hypothetical protein